MNSSRNQGGDENIDYAEPGSVSRLNELCCVCAAARILAETTVPEGLPKKFTPSLSPNSRATEDRAHYACVLLFYNERASEKNVSMS